MEKDCGSWFSKQPPTLNLSRANMVNSNETFPVGSLSGPAQVIANNATEPLGWFYCLPRFRQGFTPTQNRIIKDNLCVGVYRNNMGVITPEPGSDSTQKSFLVFDQTGDQTTIMQFPTSWSPKMPIMPNLINNNEPITKSESINRSEHFLTDVGSYQMREDTEELNALLYSDGDDCSYTDDDDEVMSTDHTPSTTTFHDKQDCEEQVASCNGTIENLAKRRRSCSSVYDDDDDDDDAQSSCVNGTFPGNKRIKREKIRETVSILQSIIPALKGKDATSVLDEAILYLNSLKVKAKTLGYC